MISSLSDSSLSGSTRASSTRASSTRSSDAPIRVLLVDDSPLALDLQKRMLATSPRIKVVATASHGREALQRMEETHPQVVCTDWKMPTMDGLELIAHVMENAPCPILVVSTIANLEDESALLPLLSAGAIDVFPKPQATQPFEQTAREFVRKIELLAGVFVFSRRATSTSSSTVIEYSMSSEAARENNRIDCDATASQVRKPRNGNNGNAIQVVAIGASTGGPQVLQTVFSTLPPNFRVPILCVQHISLGFLAGLVDWLDSSCRLRVKVMEDGETVIAGTIYFPMEGRHLEIDARGRLSSLRGASVDGHCPSVTTTFSSVARSYGADALAVLLTGMGNDGARGLQEIRAAGGATIAQDEASSVVFGMPRQAIALGAAERVLPAAAIADAICREVGV